MTQPDDETLREAFRTMARHDARRTPEFRALLARSAPRPTWQKVVPVASALALAACVLLGVRFASDPDRTPAATAPAAAAPAATSVPVSPVAVLDPAPLDFLLTVPGASGLSGVPTFLSRGELSLPGRSR